MMRIHFFVLIFLFSFVKNNVETKQIKEKPIDSSHVKIDKNTVITRNMKLHTKKRQEKNKDQDFRGEPDWSYTSFPQEVAGHAVQFKRNMSECLKEVQANDKRTVKRLSPKTDSPVHGECLIACVLKQNGVIGNGKIHKGNLIELLEKFFSKDARLMKKMEKNLDRCIALSSRQKDECVMASQLNECTNDLMAHSKHKVVNY